MRADTNDKEQVSYRLGGCPGEKKRQEHAQAATEQGPSKGRAARTLRGTSGGSLNTGPPVLFQARRLSGTEGGVGGAEALHRDT